MRRERGVATPRACMHDAETAGLGVARSSFLWHGQAMLLARTLLTPERCVPESFRSYGWCLLQLGYAHTNEMGGGRQLASRRKARPVEPGHAYGPMVFWASAVNTLSKVLLRHVPFLK
jgi:hypothetical protein